MSFFESVFTEADKVLHDFISDTASFKDLEKAGNKLVATIRSGNKILTCGNGGSMCDAMHMAEELTGRFREDRSPISAISISDPSYLTCTANDYGYDQVFSRFIRGVGKTDDVLIAISTSGNSPNIVEAVKAAREMKMTVIGLSGVDGGKMAQYCDVMIRVPHTGYSDRIQEIHSIIIHSLIQYIEENIT